MSLPNQTGVIGVANDAPYTAPNTQAFGLFQPGTVVIMNGTDYVYAQATGGAIAAGGTFALTGTSGTTSGTTYTHDIAAPGVGLNQYFFARKVASPF